MLKIVLNATIFSLYRPGAIQPTRNPGARVLEKEEHRRTSPFLSKLFAVTGRDELKDKSPHTSSSINGISCRAKSFTSSRFFDSGIKLPNGLLKFEMM